MFVRADAFDLPFRSDAKFADLVVTSVPYLGQRIYGDKHDLELGREESVAYYCESMVDIGRGIARHLKPNHIWALNIGDKSNHSGGAGGDHLPGGSKSHILKYGKFRDRTYADTQFLDVPGKVLAALQLDGWRLRAYIAWDKGVEKRESLGRANRPRPSWEPILALQKGSGRSPFYPHQMKETGTVWHFKPGQRKGDKHFAPFPDELPRRCIEAWTKEGDWVWDPFAGSGTTMRVAESMKRVGIGTDLYG